MSGIFFVQRFIREMHSHLGVQSCMAHPLSSCLCDSATIYLSILLLMDIRVVSSVEQQRAGPLLLYQVFAKGQLP